MSAKKAAVPVKAVIATGGKQYLVQTGNVISIEKLDQAVGDTVELSAVQVFDETVPTDAAGTVEAEIVEHGKGTKIRVSTYKSKKRVRRTLGHRQPYTKVLILGLKDTAKAS